MTISPLEIDVLSEINRRMNGNLCPGSTSLGECAAITECLAKGSTSSYYVASLYLHSGGDDLTPAEVASWFTSLGARSVVVSAILYDADNNINNGASLNDGVRPWEVSFFLAPPKNTEHKD